MATVLTVVTPDVNGEVTTKVAAAAAGTGNKFINTGKETIHYKNGSGAPINVLLKAPNRADGRTVADISVAVAAGAEASFGPFPPYFTDSDGYMTTDVSLATTVTVSVTKFVPSF